MPPIIEPLVFIQPGGLHGVAMIVVLGLMLRACCSIGMMYAWSWAMEKSASVGSVCPAGMSS